MSVDNFVALILTHGRPDRVFTYGTIRRRGYTGPIILVVDNTDKTIDQYREKYGDEVVVFDKKAIAETFDTGDNFEDMRTIVYARNASFQIARSLGYRYFIQLDDDYTSFSWRFGPDLIYRTGLGSIEKLDNVWGIMLEFLKSTPTKTIAMAQGGDFIGGRWSSSGSKLCLKRKAMNSFICDTENPVEFVGRINEDVNTYTRKASTGELMFTLTQVSLGQVNTQQGSGGMTDVYLASGTYVKSFYSVMYHPSSVRVRPMACTGSRAGTIRLHHWVNWNQTVPKIVSEDWKQTP